jgi:hypothetical protein
MVLRQLVLDACGLFIWAATACRFIKDSEEFAEDRLDEILKGTGLEGTPEQHLDQIYLTVLQNSIPTTFRPPEKVRLRTMQRKILRSIVILFFPPLRCLASKGNQHSWDKGYPDSRKTTSYPRYSKGCY